MLANVLMSRKQDAFNAVTFLQAASLLHNLFKQHRQRPNTTLTAIEKYIEVTVIGMQSELKSHERRVKMGQALANLASKITIQSLYFCDGASNEHFVGQLCEEIEQV